MSLPTDLETLPAQHQDYGHLVEGAERLVDEHSGATRAHLIATGEAMADLADRLGGDAPTWRVAGLLHDLDWDVLDKDAEAHCGPELERLLEPLEPPEELIGDVRSHYKVRFGDQYPLDSRLRRALYCVDELTGFCIAVTLVRPSKKIADVEVKSIKKKLKDKGFAAQVDRSQIQSCSELIGIETDEMIDLTLAAMTRVADRLGL